MVQVSATLLHLPHGERPLSSRCERLQWSGNWRHSTIAALTTARHMDWCGGTLSGSMWSKEECRHDLLIKMFDVKGEWAAWSSGLAPWLSPMWFWFKSERRWPLCGFKSLWTESNLVDAEHDGCYLRNIFWIQWIEKGFLYSDVEALSPEFCAVCRHHKIFRWRETLGFISKPWR